MSYIIEQKIKGNIYLYSVESYWDKQKKQTRQKRTYLGPKKSSHLSSLRSQIVSQHYGDIFLVRYLSKKLGISTILERIFPDCFREILSFSIF